MLVSESPKRKPKVKQPQPIAAGALLSPDEMRSLLTFVRYALGDARLTRYEEQFLCDRHIELYGQVVRLTDKQWEIVRQIKEKLQRVPLPSDTGEIEEDDDPDEPVAREPVDEFGDEEFVAYLVEA
jgi:hypothetical protein